jgi:hypothetical protein
MLLIAKKPPDELRIINVGPRESRKLLIKQKGSSYLNYCVRVNLNMYDKDGVGITDRQYYCVDETLKLTSLASSIFHEFVHCLHHIEDAIRYDRDCHSPVPKPWDNKEELRTISGYIDPDIYDPICDNCFHLYDSVVSGRPYLPRIGHCGYKSDRPRKDVELQQFYSTSSFKLDWPKQYVIP